MWSVVPWEWGVMFRWSFVNVVSAKMSFFPTRPWGWWWWLVEGAYGVVWMGWGGAYTLLAPPDSVVCMGLAHSHSSTYM